MPDPLSGLIDLDRGRNTHPTRQVYDQLRALVVSGHMLPGQRLPFGRVLATRLKISRNTVSAAIDQLAAEGYLVRSQGRRPVVVDSLTMAVSGMRAYHRESRRAIHRHLTSPPPPLASSSSTT
jgi:GntR family transcriptional regulator / MocR family aminotransferase